VQGSLKSPPARPPPPLSGASRGPAQQHHPPQHVSQFREFHPLPATSKETERFSVCPLVKPLVPRPLFRSKRQENLSFGGRSITTHVRALENRRDPELGIWTRECVLASALYTMTAGVALLVQGLRSSKRAIFPQGTTPLSTGSLGCQTQAHTHLILIYDNHTRVEL
jgi:hypothetical protein